jgi:CO/xanthine dehydrogenase FAD-binding subunit
MTGVEMPLISNRSGGAYRKIRKASGGFTIVGIASQITLKDDDAVQTCVIGVTGVNPVAFRVRKLVLTVHHIFPGLNNAHTQICRCL